MKELAKAMIQAQSNMGKLVKDAKNPHYHSDYASLNAVIETAKLSLFHAGIAVFEASGMVDGEPGQQLMLVHCESGEKWESSLPLRCKDPTNPQQMGSAQTYARRYLWTAAAGLAPQDDDGNTASPPPTKAKDLPKQVGNAPASTKAQQKKLGVLFKALDREDFVTYDLEKVTGRKGVTPATLTKDEASSLIERMTKAVEKK